MSWSFHFIGELLIWKCRTIGIGRWDQCWMMTFIRIIIYYDLCSKGILKCESVCCNLNVGSSTIDSCLTFIHEHLIYYLHVTLTLLNLINSICHWLNLLRAFIICLIWLCLFAFSLDGSSLHSIIGGSPPQMGNPRELKIVHLGWPRRVISSSRGAAWICTHLLHGYV